jgi:hypothetical protein
MISGVNAIGALWRHAEFLQWSQSHGADLRICSRVGGW